MADEVGVAILGTGLAGQMHALAARMLGARLVGVLGSTPARSDTAAAALGAEHGFADAAELIGHPAVEVVHVCTPNALHVAHVEMALARGKHVVCEKPLATTAGDAARLSALASESGLIAAVAFAYRYQSLAQAARDKVLAGDLGPVRLVHGSYLQDWLLYQDDTDWRADSEIGGPSRAFADIGSHWCDLAEWVTGQRITDLAAVTSTVYPTRRAPAASAGDGAPPEFVPVQNEDIACLVFRATGGIVGTLTVSQVSPGRKNRLWLEVDAAEASVVFDQENTEWMWLGRRSAAEMIARGNGSGPGPQFADSSFLPPGHARGFVECFTSLFSDVYRSLRHGSGRAFPTFDDGARSAVLTEAVLRSASEREWVHLP
ncbi:MAG TPA: Gfo/Idh/MocA family oxidoreductase [Streptosporangiaceae bacterium]